MQAMSDRLERLEQELREQKACLAAQQRAAARRLRLWQGSAAALAVAMSLVVPLRPGVAQGGGGNGLAQRVQELETAVSALQTALTNEAAARQAADTALQTQIAALQATAAEQGNQITALRGTLIAVQRDLAFKGLSITALGNALADETGARQAADAALQNQISPLAAKLEKVSVQQIDGAYSLVIEGANLHLRNGLGATNGNPADPYAAAFITTNRLGNLIIGYNESRAAAGDVDDRSGSHNLVVGIANNFASFGGMVVGRFNAVTAPGATVSGGVNNTASGRFGSVSGGANILQPDLAGWSAGGNFAPGTGPGSFHAP